MKRTYKESYEISSELVDELNSIVAEEYLAFQAYKMAEVAMRGKKQHLLVELSKENGKDELDDHFENLVNWMQSKGIEVVTEIDDMRKLSKCSEFTFKDGDSTRKIIEDLILSEEEAIAHYEEVLERGDVKYDLQTMLAGFLKDEREHLKKLVDIRNEMTDEPSQDESKRKYEFFESNDEDSIDGIPNWATCYIMYGDDSGLDEDDKKLVDEFLADLSNDGIELVSPIDGTENEFNSYPAFGDACDTTDWSCRTIVNESVVNEATSSLTIGYLIECAFEKDLETDNANSILRENLNHYDFQDTDGDNETECYFYFPNDIDEDVLEECKDSIRNILGLYDCEFEVEDQTEEGNPEIRLEAICHIEF